MVTVQVVSGVNPQVIKTVHADTATSLLQVVQLSRHFGKDEDCTSHVCWCTVVRLWVGD